MDKYGSLRELLKDYSKTDRIILYCLIACVPIGIFSYGTFMMIFGPSAKQVITERDSLENVSGVIDTLFNDRQNHNTRTAILKGNQIFYILPEWESKIETGDSLYKKKGSFKLEVYKKSGGEIVLDYKPTIPSQ